LGFSDFGEELKKKLLRHVEVADAGALV